MTTDIFIKSYKRDFKWLTYCLRAIHKFTKGFEEIHIVVPREDYDDISRWGLTKESIYKVNERGNPYLFQQSVKMNADTYSVADNILFVDSDFIFNTPTTPEDFMSEGKIDYLITPYNEFPPEFPWQAPTEKALGLKCPYETMRRLPLMYPREAVIKCREHVEKVHGMNITDYILSQFAFSEFNTLGSYCHALYSEPFNWIDTTIGNLPPVRGKQFWSHEKNWTDCEREMKKIVQ